jgi:hypothetical protein
MKIAFPCLWLEYYLRPRGNHCKSSSSNFCNSKGNQPIKSFRSRETVPHRARLRCGDLTITTLDTKVKPLTVQCRRRADRLELCVRRRRTSRQKYVGRANQFARDGGINLTNPPNLNPLPTCSINSRKFSPPYGRLINDERRLHRYPLTTASHDGRPGRRAGYSSIPKHCHRPRLTQPRNIS